MKSGAGDDPFADFETDDADDDAGGREDDAKSESEGASDAVVDRDRRETSGRRGSSTDRTPSPAVGGDETGGTDARAAGGQVTVDDLPYIARRNVRGNSVKTGRDKNVLFELRPEIAEREEEFVDELERRLGTDVPKTDAREAALAAIWERPELVVPVLEEWGLGYFED